MLAANGEKARALCGGTDILIQMRAGVRQPAQLIDVKRIAELNRIVFDEHTGLRLGAAVPCIEQAASSTETNANERPSIESSRLRCAAKPTSI